MLSRQLYEQLAVTFSRNNASETLWPSRRLDPLLELGTAVTNHAAACGMLAANLEQMAQCLHEVAGALPKCSSVIYINYIWQVCRCLDQLALCRHGLPETIIFRSPLYQQRNIYLLQRIALLLSLYQSGLCVLSFKWPAYWLQCRETENCWNGSR